MAISEMYQKDTKVVKKEAKKKRVSGDKMLRVELVRSLIGRPQKQREVIKGLGLRRINSDVLREDCPEIRGMIRKVEHLVRVKVVDKK